MDSPSILNFKSNTMRIIPFGGCGEFGMNLTAYIVEDRIYVVDAGISFPDPSKLGIESIYPDMDPWLEQFGGVYAYIITHGHEDHIGALPFLMQKWPGPIYATPWSAALIRNKLARRGIMARYPITEVRPGELVETEDFTVEYVHLNHSIPNACGLYIKTPTLKIFHTGDFKIDRTPVLEETADVKRLEAIGREGVDLLLADSTNAHLPGPSPSEAVVADPLRKAFDTAKGAVLITTFSSNFWRLKTICDICQEKGRRLLVLGSGLETSFQVASDIDLYKAPHGLLIDATGAQHLDRSKLAVVLTGSQGEWRSALMKLAQAEHRSFSLVPGDLCVFSSRTIPGNERVIQTMMSLLEMRGAEIYSVRQDKNIHVSGHGYRDDLKLMISSIRPKTFIPIHGTYSHLHSNANIPKELGLDLTTIEVENGDVIDLSPDGVKLSDRITVYHRFVDSESYIPLKYETMRERLRIGELGLAVVTACFDPRKKELVGDLQITLQGLPARVDEDMGEIEDICRKAAKRGIHHELKTKGFTSESLADAARVEVRRGLFSVYRKKPVVLVHVHAL